MKKPILFVIFITATFILNAQSILPFTVWKQVTQRGDVTFTGNSNLVCTSGGATCTTARGAVSPTGNGGGNNFNNNGFTMNYNNIADASDPVARFSRTNANLTLGATGGCGVIYAELVWGGSVNAATPNYTKRDSIYLKSPVGGYTGIKADIKVDTTIPFGGYYCYKDITNLVRQGGTGTYWAANLVNQTGATGLCGGWSIIVIYNDPALPLRNLTIFRGISAINATNPQNINITGFFTPPSPAAVNLKLGVYSFEGDRGTAGDSLKFNGAGTFLSVTNLKNTADNAFNSTITTQTPLAVNEVTRSPADANTLGMDLDIFTPDNSTYTYLPNSASSATIRMTSSGDVYAPFTISTAIDVFEPDISITKEWALSGGRTTAVLGDTITYTLKVRNKGTDPATNVVITDQFYGAIDYVPGSSQIINGPNAGAKTDFIGDDQVDFLTGSNTIKFRIGNGANGTTGGTMGITPATFDSTTVSFKVKITSDCQYFKCKDSVVNTAYVDFVGFTSGQGRSTASSPSGFDAFGCPLNGATNLKVIVPPCPIPADTTFSNCVPYNLSNLTPPRPGFTSFFNSGWASVTQATATGTYYATKQIYPGCIDTIQINFTQVCILPILLVDFTANYQNKQVLLNWKTATEINNKQFNIERSIDGIRFEKIGSVPGAINSNDTKLYYFVDNTYPKVNKLYYRLVQVDLNGSIKYSHTRVVALPNDESTGIDITQIAPNPVKDIVTIKIASSMDNIITAKVIDAQGKLVNAFTKTITKGDNFVQVDMSLLQKGLYFFEFITTIDGNKKTAKIMKQ
jgi:uncharacterized repeat protein (TIGR01451 family)